MKSRILFSLLFTCILAAPVLAAEPVNPYVGFWEKTYDEDGSPKDTMAILNNGTYISQGWTCQVADIIPYHIYKGDMYATTELKGKGPISIVFRHKKDGRLSFTSPRTRQNAYYSRMAKNPCPASEG